MRAFLLGVALILAACSGCVSAMGAPDEVPRGIALADDMAVTVDVTCPPAVFGLPPSGGYGTAVLIDATHALTAWHVVDACPTEQVELVWPDGKTKVLATVEAIALPGDIVRLKAVGLWPVEVPQPTVGVRPDAGDRVCAHTAYPRRRRVCGSVQRQEGDLGAEIIFDAIVEPGNSGSGLYDASGRLIGIVTRMETCSNDQICGARAATLDGRGWLL